MEFKKKKSEQSTYGNRAIITVDLEVYFKLMEIAARNQATLKEVASRLLEKGIEIYNRENGE